MLISDVIHKGSLTDADNGLIHVHCSILYFILYYSLMIKGRTQNKN